MKFIIAVYAISEVSRERALVGQTSVLADTEDDARQRAVAQLWDERLTCASCAASSKIVEVLDV